MARRKQAAGALSDLDLGVSKGKPGRASARCGRLISAAHVNEWRVMSRLLRLVREPGAEAGSKPARPALGWIARGGTGAVAAAGVVLGSLMVTPPSSAQVAVAGHSPTGGTWAWAGFAGNAQHKAVTSVRPIEIDHCEGLFSLAG